MDVRLAADCAGVAEHAGDGVDGLKNILRSARLRVSAHLPERRACENGSGPGAEILRCEVLPRNLLQVFVDVARVDPAAIAVVVDVLKELLARQIPAIPDNARQPSAADVDRVPHAALAAKLEAHRLATDGDVPVLQGGQPERPVRFRVLIVADAYQ